MGIVRMHFSLLLSYEFIKRNEICFRSSSFYPFITRLNVGIYGPERKIGPTAHGRHFTGRSERFDYRVRAVLNCPFIQRLYDMGRTVLGAQIIRHQDHRVAIDR